MASPRLLVLHFVREYIEQWSESPSYGEIANALETNRTRVRKLIRSLEAEGLILRRPGPRGLRLPSKIQQAIRQLEEMGYCVDVDAAQIHAPHGAVTHSPLLPPPALDYPKRNGAGDANGQQGRTTSKTDG